MVVLIRQGRLRLYASWGTVGPARVARVARRATTVMGPEGGQFHRAGSHPRSGGGAAREPDIGRGAPRTPTTGGPIKPFLTTLGRRKSGPS